VAKRPRETKKSHSAKCDHPAFAAYRSIVRISDAATGPRSAEINGRTMFGCLILNLCSSVRPAKQGAPMSGQILIGTKNQCSPRNRQPMKCGRVLRFGNRDRISDVKGGVVMREPSRLTLVLDSWKLGRWFQCPTSILISSSAKISKTRAA